MSKWRNHGLWVALASALLLATQAVGVLFGFEITSELVAKIMTAVNAVLGVFVVLGIISNPSQGSGFSDNGGGK